MSRPFLLLAALVVALDLLNGAVLPLGLPWALNVMIGLLLGAGVAYYVVTTHGAANGPSPGPPAAE